MDIFPAHTQRFAAGREHMDARGRAHDSLGQGRDRFGDMLAVVQDEESVTVSREDSDPFRNVLPVHRRQADRQRDAGVDLLRARDGREIDEPHIGSEVGGGRVRDGQGDRRLSQATGTDNRDEAAPSELVAKMAEDRNAADDSCGRRRQRAAARADVRRSARARREVGTRYWGDEAVALPLDLRVRSGQSTAG
jgi:hypothetical protein